MNGKSQKVYIGVGGTGNDLLNQLITTGEVKCGLFAVDTDAQALMKSLSPKRVQIGEKETRGLGTNGDAELGRRAAEDAREKLAAILKNRGGVYILASLRGGTGLGATPVLCSLAKMAKRHTTLFLLIRESIPDEDEKNILEKWRTLADELQIWHKDEQNRFVVMGG